MENIKTSLIKSLPQSYEDYSNIISEIKIELKEIGESIYGERVEKWCEKAGYKSVHHLDLKGLKGLLKAIRKIKNDKQNKT